MIGTAFYPLHLTLFFLGVPAFWDCAQAGKSQAPLAPRLPSASVPRLLSVLVLLQYGVTEALYGIDGNGEPIANSRPSRPMCMRF